MISDIRLQNFRSYDDASFEFSNGVNIVVGPNASGKTNLLEAILVMAAGSSYRAKDADLVAFTQPWARIDAHLPTGLRTVKLEAQNGTKKSFEIDGSTTLRLSLSKTMPVVVFEPNHLHLLQGSPEIRRDYLDNLLSQLIDNYTKLRHQYRRTLSQRNALLKRGDMSQQDQLFGWNIRLSELGEQIVQERQKLINTCNEHMSECYSQLSHKKTAIELRYHSSCAVERYGSSMLQKLEQTAALDFQRGFTAYGPHRDDMVVYMEGHPADITASRGEARTLLLCLKIIELTLLQEGRGQAPMLLLDDVFSELDGARRKALTGFLEKYQTFITTTDADIVVQHFMNDHNIIPL